jgi:DNA-binding response OmpR family regulator
MREDSVSIASEADGGATVLVVDDEPSLVEMYAAMLEDLYTVRTATSGTEAIDQFTDEIDVVLLDRRMPDLSGSEVLEAVRSEGYDSQVAMVTAVKPDIDILEMQFDAYLVKPVRQEDLRELVEELRLRSQHSESVQELMQVSSRLIALESEHSTEELSSHERYRTLRKRKAQLERIARDHHTELSERSDPRLLFRDVVGSTQKS